MKPPRIEVRIEELVLDGFPAGARDQIATALKSELHALLTERGVPPAWRGNPEKLDAGAIRLTNPSAMGKQIAAALYQGGSR